MRALPAKTKFLLLRLLFFKVHYVRRVSAHVFTYAAKPVFVAFGDLVRESNKTGFSQFFHRHAFAFTGRAAVKHYAFDIFADNIGFEINRVAAFQDG